MAASKPSLTDTWDSILPGPPSRNNFGSADLSPSGLFAFASGSSVSIVDSRSLQLVSTIPLPPPPGALSPFVTSVRWIPLPLPRDLLSTEPSASHLLLAVADRHGRVALVDFYLRSVVVWLNPSSDPKLGIQDLCWIQARQDSHVLAAISGSSFLSLYTTSGGLFWKYDAGTEILSCLRRDPYDSRHFCVLGLKGFLLSVKVLGDTEKDVVIHEMQIKTDFSELLRLEREAASNGNSSSSPSSSPASAAFPLYFARFAFSPHWKNILFVTFPRELLVFDLQYETPLSTTPLPRGCAKFLDVLPDPNKELLYCAHVDGRLSIWRRKEGEQVHVMCTIEEFMPSIGMSIPSPSALAVLLSQSDSTMQTITKLHPDGTSSVDFDNPFDFYDESFLVSKTTFISLSDDGKIWKWVLSAEGVEDALKNASDLDIGSGGTEAAFPGAIQKKDTSNPEDVLVVARTNKSRGHTSISSLGKSDLSVKISLTGQLQLLSSTVSTLAVPSPSLTATLARGGNIPAASVPLVALGTQSGTIDIVDVSTNAVAASTSVHTGVVRGLRWLGNSRLVSFSYSQVNDKSRGYINKLVVTCLRSGLNKPFRDLQKPERTPIRALRTSSSGRYLLILFRDAPVEVWAMTKHPVMLRSLALPFTVVEWTLPAVPRPGQGGPSKQLLSTSEGVTASADSTSVGSDGSPEETVESFAFALVNGALGVFEVQGRRIRDFRPKWPSTSFVPSDGLVTAMAYRLPHVVMGDRSGNIRWWDVTTGQSSALNTHRDGIRRIKFSPVVAGDRSRGRVAVLFNDNTFSVFDLDSPDPLAQSLLQPQIPGTLVLELDWLPLRTDKNDPLVLCIAGADSTFRLVEVTVNEKKVGFVPQSKSVKERFRPMPMYSPILLPVPHALALRMILQLGVKPSWFNTSSTTLEKRPHLIRGMATSSKDLRSYMIQLPPLGDPVVPEMLLKILEPYRKEGCLLDDERAKLYADVVKKGYAARFAFAAAVFGETSEALFWLQLPQAIRHLMNKLTKRSPQKIPSPALDSGVDEAAVLSKISSTGISAPEAKKCDGSLRLMAFEREELRKRANERLPWHEKLEGEDCIQKQVHELISVGNLEAAVSLLLSSAPDSPFFYPNALRAVALSSAVSKSLLDLALKVVAANMVRTDNSLTGTHLLCAVGRHQEACSQLQDSGRWTDAATLAATHLEGSDYARVLQRWADHVLHAEHNVWRALILYVAAGSLQEALAALREVQQPDTVAMFVLACQEIHSEIVTELSSQDDESESSSGEGTVSPDLPGLEPGKEEVTAVCEYFQQYQRKLVHLCMDSQPYTD